MLDYLHYRGIHIKRARRLLVALLFKPQVDQCSTYLWCYITGTNMLSKIVFHRRCFVCIEWLIEVLKQPENSTIGELAGLESSNTNH